MQTVERRLSSIFSKPNVRWVRTAEDLEQERFYRCTPSKEQIAFDRYPRFCGWRWRMHYRFPVHHFKLRTLSAVLDLRRHVIQAMESFCNYLHFVQTNLVLPVRSSCITACLRARVFSRRCSSTASSSSISASTSAMAICSGMLGR